MKKAKKYGIFTFYPPKLANLVSKKRKMAIWGGVKKISHPPKIGKVVKKYENPHFTGVPENGQKWLTPIERVMLRKSL